MQCLFALSEAQRSRRCGEKHMSETVTGYIDHVIFRNEDNGYTVMVLKGTKKEEELTCVGSFPAITQGASIEATGVYIHHPVYGKQFQISSFTEKMPEDTYGIERYLGSGAIRGIGAALAARIVRKFGDDTLRIVEEEPERLAEVKGISEKKAREIAAQVSEKAEMRKVMIFLQKYGISLNLGAKIYQKYKESVYTILQENPYRLAEDISGVGFKIADEIAARVGIHADSDYRIRSGMLYTLLQASGEGHTYLPREQLFTRCARLLGVDESYMEKHLMDMVIDRKLVLKEKSGETIVYPAQYYYLELNTARMLNELNIVCPEDKELVRHRIELIEKETGTVLDEMQKKAITEAADHGLFILTGGPGTGKTTTINAIIRFFEGEGAEIRLAAPTGRAAKRMTETTGYEAQTIHRLLELNGMPEEERDGHSAKFERNAQNPLEADVIIIDEMSMVDIALMHSLLLAITAGTRLILVGDENQLPSVGPGNVLRDLINSKFINVVRLKEIFRQGKESMIIVNAHKINNGEMPYLNKKGGDFFFDARDEVENILSTILDLVNRRLPSFNTKWSKIWDIQVLSPTRKGILGVDNLNNEIQAILNPSCKDKKEKQVRDIVFREGDKVMQIKNNYSLEWHRIGGDGENKGVGVFNGDMGYIETIDEERKVLSVVFDDERRVVYEFMFLDELELAYAITIHKSQGSEFKVVVMPTFMGSAFLMNRNILYTGITRAKELVVVVGNQKSLQYMVNNTNNMKRYSSLKERIMDITIDKNMIE